nr:MAG TPA: hypothetical protein [Caudoviricetes sp.]
MWKCRAPRAATSDHERDLTGEVYPMASIKPYKMTRGWA